MHTRLPNNSQPRLVKVSFNTLPSKTDAMTNIADMARDGEPAPNISIGMATV